MKKNYSDGYNKICSIYYHNFDNFDTAIMISRNDNEIVYISFNMFGEYNGNVYQNYLSIDNIYYDDRWVPFYEKIVDKTKINYLNLLTKEDFINYALKNNRILAILTDEMIRISGEDFDDVKVIDFDGVYLKYQIYERWGELRKRIRKVKISKIVMMQVDSKYQRLLEKYISECE